MSKTKPIPEFTETNEQRQQLEECIERYKNDRGAVMPILQETQEIYGYLPIEVLRRISAALDEPLERLYGVGTFYSQFSFEPKGEYVISVCMGTACYVKGAGDILDDISRKIGIAPEETSDDGKFTLTACRCIGACGLAPVLTINGEVFGRLTTDDVDAVLEPYLA